MYPMLAVARQDASGPDSVTDQELNRSEGGCGEPWAGCLRARSNTQAQNCNHLVRSR